MRYLVPILIVTAALLAADYYVYRSWRRLVYRTRLHWTLIVYRITLGLMPLTLPLYLNLFSWWEVEPRAARALFFAFWALYYVPKVPIVGVLLAKDALGFLRRVRDRVMVSKDSENEGEQGRAPVREEADAITRAEFIRRLGWTAAAVPFLVTGYGVYRTLYDFAVHRIDVPIAGLPQALEGLTIAQVSDIHAGSLFSDRPMLDAVHLINELRPDVVALTGDFVNHDTAELPTVLPAMHDLRADIGIYGCLGNHDHYADTERLVGQLRSTPIDLLINEHRTYSIDGARLHVIGTDNTGFRQRYGDLNRATAGINPDEEGVQILLAHDPTYWDEHVRPQTEDIDLMLCGHTHGGQFGIELGPLRWSLAALRYERWAGLYEEERLDRAGRQFLYVNRGLGTVGPPLRLGIRPEITLLTLRRA